MKTLREMMDLIESAQRPHQSNIKNPVDFPRTWHDVDPKLGKVVDKMSQAEKVKKGMAHPDTLKKKGVAEGSETAADIDKKIEFHKQGQAAAQYKGAMNKMHAAKIRELLAKKEALKQGVAEEQVEESSPDALSKIDELFRK